MKAKIFIFLIIFNIIIINVIADDEYFPETGFFDRVNRVKNVNNAGIFELFHFSLYLEWRQQTTAYSINRLTDIVETSRMYVYDFCEWNINEMFILRKRFDNVNAAWVAFIWVNSENPMLWHVQLYALEN